MTEHLPADPKMTELIGLLGKLATALRDADFATEKKEARFSTFDKDSVAADEAWRCVHRLFQDLVVLAESQGESRLEAACVALPNDLTNPSCMYTKSLVTLQVAKRGTAALEWSRGGAA